jgi:copper type II ascorbate-dependent monooxygenase-like protein
MRARWTGALVLVVCAVGCGGSDDEPEVVDPHALLEGYTRFVATPTPPIEPGADAMFVQWLSGPTDTDRDVLDVRGWQSEGGHHVILFATPEEQPVGTTRVWEEADMAGDLRYVGGIGEGAGKQRLPDGTVFRIPAGYSLIANLHYLNSTESTLVGGATIDLDLRGPSSDRKPVGIYLNMTLDFTIPANGSTTAETTCTVQEDLSLIRIANHMHSYGAAASTDITHTDGSFEELIVDDVWSPELYLNPPLREWPLDAPYVLRAGDVIHTVCTWHNTESTELAFPNEMCTAVGYFVSDDGRVQPCLDGSWL